MIASTNFINVRKMNIRQSKFVLMGAMVAGLSLSDKVMARSWEIRMKVVDLSEVPQGGRLPDILDAEQYQLTMAKLAEKSTKIRSLPPIRVSSGFWKGGEYGDEFTIVGADEKFNKSREIGVSFLVGQKAGDVIILEGDVKINSFKDIKSSVKLSVSELRSVRMAIKAQVKLGDVICLNMPDRLIFVSVDILSEDDPFK